MLYVHLCPSLGTTRKGIEISSCVRVCVGAPFPPLPSFSPSPPSLPPSLAHFACRQMDWVESLEQKIEMVSKEPPKQPVVKKAAIKVPLFFLFILLLVLTSCKVKDETINWRNRLFGRAHGETEEGGSGERRSSGRGEET